MRELDDLLTAYLEQHYDAAGGDDRLDAGHQVAVADHALEVIVSGPVALVHREVDVDAYGLASVLLALVDADLDRELDREGARGLHGQTPGPPRRPKARRA